MNERRAWPRKSRRIFRCRSFALLYRSRGETRHRCTARIGERRHIADHKNLAMSRHTQILFDEHSPDSVGWCSQLFAKQRREDTGDPQRHVCFNPFVSDFYPSALNCCHHTIGVYFDSELLQLLLSFPG